MMDIATLSQLISTIGFPIAACVYLAFSNEKLRTTIDENTRTIAELKTVITLYLRNEETKKGV